MSAATESDLKMYIAKLMKTKNTKTYKFEIIGNSNKGDGYLGEVVFGKVTTPAAKDLNLVIKFAKQSNELRKQLPIKEAYDREIFFYDRILPVLMQLQQEEAVEEPFRNVPKCFSVFAEDRKEALVLENLKTRGFDLHPRTETMNLNHILVVFQKYGQYHALSIALRAKKPAVFDDLTRNLTDVLGKFVVQADMLPGLCKDFEHVKTLLRAAGKEDIVRKYEGFEKEFENIMTGFQNKKPNVSVITHGDCWNNNFMFKYEGSDRSKPVEMSFLDFQLMQLGSPILDLSYFLYSCGDGKVFKDIDFLLQAYHSSLTNFLDALGCDSDDVAFTLETLKREWRVFGRFGVVLSLFIFKICLCDGSDAPDFIETAEKGDGFSDSFDIKLNNQDKYDLRVTDLYVHFAEKFM